MFFDPEPVKKWFGYNRKERRATSILILLIILVWFARFTVPAKNVEIINLSPELLAAMEVSTPESPSFLFDPNNASFDTLVKAGFTEREARTLVNYRSKGGKFYKPADIQRLYGLDSQKAATLIPYIRIDEDSGNRSQTQKLLIEINSSDSATLERLPGIGPVLSSRIVKYRNLLGGYYSVNQLREVYGLPPETFERIRSMVYADTSHLTKIDINRADYSSLARVPYLKRFNLTDILKFRELGGKISSLNDLVKNNVISDSVASKIRPYVVF